MARPKKPTYEYVEKLKLYRKRIKDADGKYVAIYGKTPDELTEKVKDAQFTIDGNLLARENPTMADYADRWMALNTANVSSATRMDYQYIINNYIKEQLGSRRLREITPDDVKAAMLSARNRSASVNGKLIMLYKRIFTSAVESDIISKSPCPNLKQGGIKPKEKHALNKEQIITLLAAVDGTIAHTFVMLGLYTGMRREEILGLQWDCIFLDQQAPYIAVRQAVRWERNQPVVDDTLKSKAAKRDIPIPQLLVNHLVAERELSKSGFVLCNRSGGPKSETQFRNMWHAVVCMVKERTYTKYDGRGNKVIKTIKPEKGEQASHRKYQYTIDFEVTPHILRHTYISNLLLAGVDVKTVQYLAGHEHAKITLDIYAHLTYNQPEDLISKVNMAFS